MRIVHLKQVSPEVTLKYFQDLADADLLKYRFADIENPTIEDVKSVIQRMGQNMFFTTDETGIPNAEFMFDTFLGKTSQIHFSMSPNNTPNLSLHLAATATDTVLSKWGVAALWGLTAVPNRVARIFNVKVGFKTVAILPQSVKYMGKLVDAVMTIKKPGEADG